MSDDATTLSDPADSKTADSKTADTTTADTVTADSATGDTLTADTEPAGRVQIGVVAERLGLSVRTLHHWEEVGLVTPSARSAGGFRLYTEDDIARLTIIRRMKPLGFSLDEMRELLDAFELLHTPGADDATVAAADASIAACRERVADRRGELQRLLVWADEFDDLLARRAL